ncbi:hypothetical protein JOB18_002234 [Solea senegalensis]|uniref:Uncharacterized protein n=1 Tax=Solea senegalensis TaxID=28829 RepID=A0AAV6T2V0_SOLSE|nr:hypothetical protein JOB18_002234 [Solea senegalensis]
MELMNPIWILHDSVPCLQIHDKCGAKISQIMTSSQSCSTSSWGCSQWMDERMRMSDWPGTRSQQERRALDLSLRFTSA